jgi:hypothetical protein
MVFIHQDCSFPAYFYTQPMATGPGFYDNLCPQSWQDGSAATFTLQDPHQQSTSPTETHHLQQILAPISPHFCLSVCTISPFPPHSQVRPCLLPVI